MPSKYSLFKSNKSQASLLNSPEARSQQTSPTDTPLQSPAFPPTALGISTVYGDNPKSAFAQQQDINRDAAQYYQGALPSRSQSQRVPHSNYAAQPTIHLVRPPHSSPESPPLEDDPHNFYNPPVNNNPKQEPEQKRSKRSFFGLSHSTKESSSHSSTSHQQPSKSLGRSVSVRRKTPAYIAPDDQQHWHEDQNANPRLTPAAREEEGGARLDRFLAETNKPIPPTPGQAPLRSPIFPPSPPQQHSQMRGPLQRVNTDSSIRQTQRRDDYESPQRETGPPQPPPHQRDLTQPSSTQSHYQSYQPPPPTLSNTYHPLQGQRPPDNKSQHSFQQPQDIQRMRPPSQQSYEPPSPSTSYKAYDPQSEPPSSRASQQQTPSAQYMQGSMAPPPGQPQQSRRSAELNLPNPQGGPHQGASNVQGYGQAHGQNVPASGQYPGPPPGPGQPGGNYRGPPPNQASISQQEQGRNTPPLGKSRDEGSGADVPAGYVPITRHDELRKSLVKPALMEVENLTLNVRGQI